MNCIRCIFEQRWKASEMGQQNLQNTIQKTTQTICGKQKCLVRLRTLNRTQLNKDFTFISNVLIELNVKELTTSKGSKIFFKKKKNSKLNPNQFSCFKYLKNYFSPNIKLIKTKWAIPKKQENRNCVANPTFHHNVQFLHINLQNS